MSLLLKSQKRLQLELRSRVQRAGMTSSTARKSPKSTKGLLALFDAITVTLIRMCQAGSGDVPPTTMICAKTVLHALSATGNTELTCLALAATPCGATQEPRMAPTCNAKFAKPELRNPKPACHAITTYATSVLPTRPENHCKISDPSALRVIK